jgi:hypothetical protein
MIQKEKYEEAKEFWLAFSRRFLEEHGGGGCGGGGGEQLRSLAQLTSAEQLQPLGEFLQQHPLV